MIDVPRSADAAARFNNAHDQPHRSSQWVGTELKMLFRTSATGSSRQRIAIGAHRIAAPFPALDPPQAAWDAFVIGMPVGFRARSVTSFGCKEPHHEGQSRTLLRP